MERLLIVDDNPKNIELLGNVLSENNFEVEYALDGEEALNILEEDEFDLILMDIMMPNMDGFETCKRIKQMKGKSEIPLIFLTAINETESISRGFELGGVDYLTKPFNTEELLARVNTHISLKKSRDELSELNQSLEEKVRKRTAELVNVNEKLELANKDLAVLDQSKNEFLNIINHEIRTPLNGILGFSGIIKETIKNEVVVSMINMLDESCNRLEKFSLLALDISRLNSLGPEALDIEPLDINELMEITVTSVQENIEKKNISIDKNIEKNIINIDKEYFHKCFKILIINALKHSPENSKISITGKIINDVYSIIIKDEGNGFPEILLNKGIKSFITNHIDKNPGLELYLSKLIAESHKGKILLKNQQGALVEILLPLNQ